MTLTIFILAYMVLLVDLMRSFTKGNSNVLISMALITLLSWQQNTAWGITTLCIGVAILIVAMVNANDIEAEQEKKQEAKYEKKLRERNVKSKWEERFEEQKNKFGGL